ncbi:Hypothetical protein SMAX5B_014409 [Scophthalmus maximus]|uniref:Uncharacterized protein n=1 Tax=Scophthalmus maximus TaxID=52904 RepID=A0A2U9CB13_SCOMX|nr:Hypothetical protein SMAX5B_014409 [Scophthalmus maximus]
MLPVNCCRSLNIVLRDNRLRSAVVEEGGRKEQTERGFRSVVAHSSPLRLLGGAASGASAASSRARTAQAATSPSQREALQLLQRCVDAHGPSDAPTACVQSDSMRSSSMRRLSVPSEPQVSAHKACSFPFTLDVSPSRLSHMSLYGEVEPLQQGTGELQRSGGVTFYLFVSLGVVQGGLRRGERVFNCSSDNGFCSCARGALSHAVQNGKGGNCCTSLLNHGRGDDTNSSRFGG